jgi:L-fucose mutarotase/ribose pyranase (RbsD/FucU family)
MDPEIISIDVFGVNKVFVAITANTRRGSCKGRPRMSQTTEAIIAKAKNKVQKLVPIARTAIVYKSSIAYAIQSIRSFVAVIDSLKDCELTP